MTDPFFQTPIVVNDWDRWMGSGKREAGSGKREAKISDLI
jgi:hypothetical protein